VLQEAYNTPFRGNVAEDFLKFLSKQDEGIRDGEINAYAKALSVVQSSATGKSRLLTQVSIFS
jgi:hypothetical protein